MHGKWVTGSEEIRNQGLCHDNFVTKITSEITICGLYQIERFTISSNYAIHFLGIALGIVTSRIM